MAIVARDTSFSERTFGMYHAYPHRPHTQARERGGSRRPGLLFKWLGRLMLCASALFLPVDIVSGSAHTVAGLTSPGSLFAVDPALFSRRIDPRGPRNMW